MATLTSLISPKDGFHPASITTLTFRDLLHRELHCSIHLYYTFQPLVFVDPYELAHHEEFYTFKHWGTSNLELPVGAVQNGSSLLLNVHALEGSKEIEVKLPLHLRYGDPASASSSGYHTEEVEWPKGFFACPISESSSVLKSSRLPDVSLPSEVAYLFPPLTTTLIPISYGREDHFDVVRVPTGSMHDLGFVEAGTMLAIILSFFYLARISWTTACRMNTTHMSKLD